MMVTTIDVPVVAMVVVMPARPVVAGVVTPIYWSVIAIPIIRVAVVVGAIMVAIDRAKYQRRRDAGTNPPAPSTVGLRTIG